MLKFYTIGHSNHKIEDFIKILIVNKINLLVDVRSLPGSRKYPQFNQENLEATLDNQRIKYLHLKTLGGLRNKDKSSKYNLYWINQSFKNYADYALTKEFDDGLNELIKLGKEKRCVIMCAEVLWWRCHRRIITDYLLIRNYDVVHIFNLKKNEKATLNKIDYQNK